MTAQSHLPAVLWAFASLCLSAYAQTAPPGIDFQREVKYREGGGPEWRLDYAKPANPPQPLPAIVIIHGGGWIEGDKSSYDQLIIDWAGLGFFAMSINYRLADATHSTFPQAIEDCKCAVRWLRAHADQFNVDKDRIGVYGSSAGGHLALMLGILSKRAGDDFEGDGPYREQSSDVCAVVSDSGIVNLDQSLPGNATLGRVMSQFLGGTPPLPDRVKKASPSSYADRATQLPPFLLVYGSTDTQVPIDITEAFVKDFREHKHPDLTFTRYDGGGHCPFFMENVPGSRAEVERFIIRTIKDRKPAESTPKVSPKTP